MHTFRQEITSVLLPALLMALPCTGSEPGAAPGPSGSFVLVAPASWRQQVGGAGAVELTRLGGAKVIAAGAGSKVFRNAESLIDGDERSEFTFQQGNSAGWVLIDLGRPCVVEGVRISNAVSAGRLIWLDELFLGPDPGHLRPLLNRRINLAIR